jgi:hypothetical protein
MTTPKSGKKKQVEKVERQAKCPSRKGETKARREKKKNAAADEESRLQEEAENMQRVVYDAVSAGKSLLNDTKFFIASSIVSESVSAMACEYPQYFAFFSSANKKIAELAPFATQSTDISALRVEFSNLMDTMADRCLGVDWASNHHQRQFVKYSTIPPTTNLTATRDAIGAMPRQASVTRKKPADQVDMRGNQQSGSRRLGGLLRKMEAYTSCRDTGNALLSAQTTKTGGKAKSEFVAQPKQSSESLGVVQLDFEIGQMAAQLQTLIRARASRKPYASDPAKTTGLSMYTDMSNMSNGDMIACNIAGDEGSPLIHTIFQAMFNPNSINAKRDHESRRSTGRPKRARQLGHRT